MKEVKRYLESRIGTYGFYFEDLTSGFVYGYNENKQMLAAGCMKMFIGVSLIKAVEDKKLEFMDKVLIKKDEKISGTGIIHEFGEREYTIFELLVAMLIQSDNTAANKIIDIIGMEKINEDIKDMHLKNTFLNRKSRNEGSPSDGIENITTAYDLASLWRMLYRGEYLEKDDGIMVIDILRRQQIRNKMSLYIPDNLKVEISSKSGDKEGIQNDSEFIQLDKGNFSATILSSGTPNSVYGIVTLAKSGKMIWDNIMTNWS